MRAVVLLAALFLSFAVPAGAADVSAAQNVIRSQEQAFARGDAAAAYSHAAPAIQQIFPHAEIFMQMVQQGYAPVFRHQSFEFGEARWLTVLSPNASISSMRKARPGRRSIRWSSSPTAA